MLITVRDEKEQVELPLRFKQERRRLCPHGASTLRQRGLSPALTVLGSCGKIIYQPIGLITTLHLGSVSERANRSAMGRKADRLRRTPRS